jgi:SPP1 gp7 family putative phage head morphogenesis protein
MKTLKTEPIAATEPAHKNISFANAPAGRTVADLKRRDKEFSKLIEDGKADLVKTWDSVYPQALDKLNSAVFKPDGNGWKITNPDDIRKLIYNDGILRYKSSEIRKSMDAGKTRGWEMGNGHAQEVVKVKAVSVVVTPKIMTDTMAKSLLRSRTAVEINGAYQAIEKEMYYLLENAMSGGQSPQAVSAKMREVLAQGGFNPAHATTIVNTSLNWTYNEARMNLYRSLQDPTGQIPGSIKGYVFAAVLDGTTTDICTAYDGQAFAVDDPNLPQPPLHYNCRSQLIPVFDDEQPWNSSGEFMSLDASKALSADIPSGFGGVA